MTVPKALSLVITLVFPRVSKDSLCWSSQVRPGTMTGGCIHRPSACVLMKIKLTYWKSYSDQRLPLIFPELGQVIFPGNLFWIRRGNHNLVPDPSLPMVTSESFGNVLPMLPASAPAYNSQWKTTALSKSSHTLNSTRLQTPFIVLVYWAFTTPSLCRYIPAQITFKWKDKNSPHEKSIQEFNAA